MIKSLSLLLCSLLFLSTSSQAAIYKGQKVYMKKCRKCHENVQRMTASKDSEAWGLLMMDEGKGLSERHLADPAAKKSWSYFQGDDYKSKSKHLMDFLIEYAQDSGNVPIAH